MLRPPELAGDTIAENAHDDDDLGRHHRHTSVGDDTEITVQHSTAHAACVLHDVAQRPTTEDTA